MPHEFNVLALVKGQERYIFVYDDDSRQQVIDAFRDQAADPHLNLTWFDAVVLTNKAKEQGNDGLVKSRESRVESRKTRFENERQNES